MPTITGPLISGMSSLSAANANASAMRSQGKYQEAVSRTNAAIAERKAGEAVERGEQNVRAIQRKARRTRSEQRAAAAAQGQDAEGGDFADLALETSLAAGEDVKVAKSNAWAEAWGFETEAINATAAGKFAAQAAENQASSTILTGGMQALGGLGEWAGKKAIRDKENAKEKK